MDITNLFTNHLQWFQKAGPRPVGSNRNKEAGQYIQDAFVRNGYTTETMEFPSCYWSHQMTQLSINRIFIKAVPNSYTAPCSVNLPYVTVNSIRELENAEFSGKIAVLYGELTKEPLSPKNNKFFNPEQHKHIINLLETKIPSAIICISRELEKPVPIIEDCDFNIPSVTVSALEGLQILMQPEGCIQLNIPSQRSTGNASNIIGRKGDQTGKKLVICANFDTRYYSTGAFDNASGTAALLTVAEILAQENMSVAVELIAFNDEEYTAKGAITYLEKYRNAFPQIITAINLDGIGNRLGTNCMTTFETTRDTDREIDTLLKNYPDITRVDPWYSEDHTIFLLSNVPTLAFSSVDFPPIVHTEWDTMEWVDPQKAERIISFILDYIEGKTGLGEKARALSQSVK